MNKVEVEIQCLPHYGDLPMIDYQTEGAAGFDFYAALDESLILAPGQSAMVPTGLCFALPEGLEMQVRPRSGLAAKFGVTVLNSPGTVDCDYRGEVKVIMINLGRENFVVERGMRIAQGVIAPYVRADFKAVSVLSETKRGNGGFGHTGV